MLQFLRQSSHRMRIIFALISGMLASTALAPLYLLPMLYLAFCVLGLLCFSASSQKAAFYEGLAFGVGYFGISMYWITAAMLVDPNAHGWLAPIALPIMSGILALFIALPVAFSAGLPAIGSQFYGLVITLTLGEWLRGYLFNFPWNNFSQSYGLGNFLLQPLSFFGRDGYSLLVILSLLLIPLAVALPKRRISLLSYAAAIPIFFALWGLVRLDQAPDSSHHYWPNAGIRIVQPNIPQVDKINPQMAGQNLTKLIDLSFEDLPGWIGHIIWPEVALHLNIDNYPNLQKDLSSLLPVGGVLITGTLRKENNRYYNTAVAINSNGQKQILHDKVTLVPFGEYMPLPFLQAIAGIEDGGFAAGSGLSNQSVGLLPYFSTLICYEGIFAGMVRPDDETTSETQVETQWLLNLTNDGWFGNTAGPYQHMAISRWRAIEEGLPLIRAANTGISVVFDGYGRILSQRALGTEGTINIRVPKPNEDSTFYSHNRYILWLGMLIILTLALGLTWFKEAKPRLKFEL